MFAVQQRFNTPQRQAFGSKMLDRPISQQAKVPEPGKSPVGSHKIPFFNTNNLDLKILASIMPLAMLATGLGMVGSMSRIEDKTPSTTKVIGKTADSLHLHAKAVKTATHIK